MHLNLLLVILIYIGMTVIGMYLAFYRFPSDTWIKQFGIWDDKPKTAFSYKTQAISKFVYSNSLRATLLLIIASITIPLLSREYGGIEFIIKQSTYKIAVTIMVISTTFWCFIIGPLNLARKWNSTPVFREHFLPYILDFPTIGAPMIILAPILFGSLLFSSIKDYQNISTIVNILSQSIRSIRIENILDYQNNLIKIINFGLYLSNRSQKYITVGVLWFLYSLAEQKTYMQKTTIQAGVNLIRTIVITMMLIGVVFGMIVLPIVYSNIYSDFQTIFSDNIVVLTNINNATHVLELHNILENHNIEWFFQEVITGYGNILVYTIMIIGFILRNRFFRGPKLDGILEFFLPSRVFRIIRKLSRKVGIIINHDTKKYS